MVLLLLFVHMDGFVMAFITEIWVGKLHVVIGPRGGVALLGVN